MATFCVGQKHELSFVVTEELCAKTVGSGSLMVLATPMMVAAMEKAACAAIQDSLEGDETTVGTKLDIEHIAPTPVGGLVTVQAEVIEVNGRALSFRVSASDNAGVIGQGTHNRFLIFAEKFMAKAATRTAS